MLSDIKATAIVCRRRGYLASGDPGAEVTVRGGSIDHAVSAAELELVNASFYLPWGTAPPAGCADAADPVQTRADRGQTPLTGCLDEVGTRDRVGGMRLAGLKVRVPCWEVMLSDR